MLNANKKCFRCIQEMYAKVYNMHRKSSSKKYISKIIILYLENLKRVYKKCF